MSERSGEPSGYVQYGFMLTLPYIRILEYVKLYNLGSIIIGFESTFSFLYHVILELFRVVLLLLFFGCGCFVLYILYVLFYLVITCLD